MVGAWGAHSARAGHAPTRGGCGIVVTSCAGVCGRPCAAACALGGAGGNSTIIIGKTSVIVVDAKQTKLTLTGIDRQKVGQVAAEMRSLRPPDPYKNKGVRYSGERLKKKAGKAGAATKTGA